MLSFLGILLFMLAAVDAGCLLFGWSLTDYSWSPLIFGALGFLLVTLEALERDSNPARQVAPQQAWTRQPEAVAQSRNPLLRSTEG